MSAVLQPKFPSLIFADDVALNAEQRTKVMWALVIVLGGSLALSLYLIWGDAKIMLAGVSDGGRAKMPEILFWVWALGMGASVALGVFIGLWMAATHRFAIFLTVAFFAVCAVLVWFIPAGTPHLTHGGIVVFGTLALLQMIMLSVDEAMFRDRPYAALLMVVAGALAALYLHILAIRSDWLAVTLGAFGFYVVAVVFVLWPPRMLSQQAAGQSASSTPPTDIPKSRPIRLVPSVEALMFLKAMICIGIGLQLSYPAVGVLPQYLAPEIEASSPDISLCSPTANDSSPNIVRWPNPLNRTLYETDEETNTICPVDPETATAVTSEEVAAAITGEATQSGQGADESVQQLFTPFGSWFQDESLWAVLIFFVFAALYFLEYEWIARPYISQRQVQSLDRGPRRSYLYQHDLDPVWIAEEKSNCEKRRLAKGLGPTAEDKKHEMNMRLRRLELYRKPRFRAFETTTFPYTIAKGWLPSIVVRVNLGFDKMDHRGVTHAMLMGLADVYKQRFLSWQSPFHVISQTAMVLLLLLLVAAFGRGFVDPTHVLSKSQGAVNEDQGTLCQQITPTSVLVHDKPISVPVVLVPGLVCDVFGPTASDSILKVLFTPLLTIPVNPAVLERVLEQSADGETEGTDGLSDGQIKVAFRPIFTLLHVNYGLPDSDGNRKPTLSFRIYHVLIFVALLILLRVAQRRFPILPYRKIHDRITGLSDDLLLRRTDRKKRKFGFPRIGENLFAHEGETERSREALDPRSVELALMRVLNEIQESNKVGLIVPMLSFNVPTPEVHFVFDELDKIGGVVGAEDTSHGVGEAEARAVDAERRRTYELHALLSDMKRVISSAPARFIFVGGRALHDEWIRDVNRMGTRQPLLSSIFDAEVYLPSLLLDLPRPLFDHSKDGGSYLNARVRQYFERLYEASKNLDKELQLTRALPFFASPLRPHPEHDFDEHSETIQFSMTVVDARLREKLADGEPVLAAFTDTNSWILSDLTDFLAFRSAGSPKRLRETLQQLVRPAGSFFRPNDDERFTLVPDRDMVVIDRIDLYRLQFVAYVFRHIDRRFGDVLVQRDDKVAINVFFMFDYLMKLHGRAFSLSSLERLDELAHVHRAPDLRRMLERVVGDSSEEFFHRMLNGLYSYRFQSDLAMEIQYLSRLSEPEMAALNFTLDESQELKSTYSTMLAASGEENPDIISALGELYEFDQAYDVARSHYERAIRMIDDQFLSLVGRTATVLSRKEDTDTAEDVMHKIGQDISGGMDFATIDAILRGSRNDRKILSAYMPWAVRRLRLMIQVGLTFELIGDEERALAQYHSAHTFARAITDVAFPSRDDRRQEQDNDRFSRVWLTSVLENLTLLYQPLLSMVWVSEKLEGAVDTSIELMERELRDLSIRLPFVRDPNATSKQQNDDLFDRFGRSKHAPARNGSNFALLMAELRNKAGDLYFFKGRMPLSADTMEEVQSLISGQIAPALLHNQEVQKLKGYLPISRLHYVTALHEIRRFCCYRNDLSGGYFNRMGETETDRTKSTLRSGTWPSFVHLTAASSLVDLGELMRGGLTGSLILKDHDDLDPNGPDSVLEESYLADIEKAFSQWVESPDDRVNQDAVRKAVTVDQVWASYLGVWHPDRAGDKRNGQRVRLEFEPSRKDALFLGFAVSVLGADQTRKGGLPIAAANEYEIVLTHIGRMLRNILVLRKLKQRAPAIKNLDLGVDTGQIRIVEKLASLALSVLERLETLRRADGSADKFGYRIGYDVPVSLATSVLNLTWTLAALRDSLRASQKGPMSVALKQFDKCLEDWFGKPEHEDFYDMRWLKMGEHRTIQLCRSRLLRMADRHHFPVLSSLEIKKSLIDMVLLGMRADDGALSELSTETELPADLKARRKHVALSPIETLDSRWTEALGWLDELVHKEQLVDAQMHFTPTKLAETMALFAVMMPGDLLKKKKKPRKTLKADAVDLIDRAEQSFSMGRQYYSNINKLYYNFDDFNDRSRHAEHSASMMMADVLAYLRVAVKSTPE